MRRLRSVPALGILLFTLATAAAAQSAERCEPSPERDAGALLARGVRAAIGSGPLRLHAETAVSQNFQSERTYPPYLFLMQGGELWYDPATGVERTGYTQVFPFGVYPPQGATLSSATATFRTGGDSLAPAAPWHVMTLRSRPMNAWAVLHDWSADGSVRVAGRCRYRDYPRTVLERRGPFGPERLYLSETSALPVRLARREPDPLWGTVAVDYLYTAWVGVGGGQFPMASYRIVEGEAEWIRTAAALPLPGADSTPDLALPADAPDMTAAALAPRPDREPDTVRVSDRTWLLTTPAYTNVVTLRRDTVFVLDAQYSGDVRAARDSAWIARLFPGRHPVVLVVSDLAWPHIQGVRFWVARGAIVVSHEASRSFLERVVARRWTDRPDRLEQARASGEVPFRFRPVRDSLRLAGGELVVHAIDGVGSEGALMTWLPRDRFLYAGDFIQRTDQPTAYAREVWEAVRRVGIAPERTAAMHLPLTGWGVVEGVVGQAN